jgi:transcriptional regulator with XRE-family HTH domain
MNKLGLFVREKRLSQAFTQEQMARKIGITSVSLSNLENGKHIGSNILRKLASHFNVSTRLLREMMLIKIEENDNENNKQT